MTLHPALPILTQEQIRAEVNAANFAGDMRIAGAQCDICPLGPHDPLGLGNNFKPVESELNGTEFVLAGDNPGETEVLENRPFVGPSGQLALRALGNFNVRRSHVSWINTCSCRMPNNEAEKVLHRVQTENRKREKAWDKAVKLAKKEKRPSPPKWERVPTPYEACRPRYIKEVALHSCVIPTGGAALKSLLGAPASIMDRRGGPFEGSIDAQTLQFWNGPGPHPLVTPLQHVRVLPTVHPSFVLHSPKWDFVFVGDIGRAFRYFANALNWKQPNIFCPRTPAEARQFLVRFKNRSATVDTETFGIERRQDALEPLIAGLRTIQIGDEDDVMVVPFASVHGSGGTGTWVNPWYTEAQIEEFREVIREFLLDPAILKMGWNVGYYDRLVFRTHFGIGLAVVMMLLDGILVWRLVASEMPKSLAFVGSTHRDVPAWKADHAGTEAKDDGELWIYGGIDVAVPHSIIKEHFAKVMKPIAEGGRGQGHLIPFDHKSQSACVGMHVLGMRIDQKKRSELGVQLLKDKEHFRRECNQLIGSDIIDSPAIDKLGTLDDFERFTEDGVETEAAENEGFSPGSYAKLRDVLFEKWRLPITHFTDLGEPSTRNEALVALIVNPVLTDPQRAFIRALRMYRRAVKMFGTYIARLDPNHPTTRLSADGRVHPNYNAHGTNVGRLSSSDPNWQNVPLNLRSMVIPEDGHVFVGADSDQLQARIISAVARLMRYLAVFADPTKDPHSVTAVAMFQDRYRKAKGFKGEDVKPEKDTDADTIRGFAKNIYYAGVFKANVETIHKQITSVEDNDGELINANVKLGATRQAYRSWMENMPELPRWWDAVCEEFKQQGYLLDPVTGRRCDFLDGFNPNAIINYKIITAEAGIMMKIMHDIVDATPFHYAGEFTGLVAQTHDANYLEVPIKDAVRKMHELTEHMHAEYPSLPDVSFTGEAEIARNWSFDKDAKIKPEELAS